MTLRRAAIAVGTLLAATATVVADAAIAQEQRRTTTPRVRGYDSRAIDLLQRAARLSPTVARLVVELEQSDLVVIVETGWLPDNLGGRVRIAAATPQVRYVVVTLRIPAPMPELLQTLGHELRHATEIARAPDVRDAETLAAFYRRVGVALERSGRYDTEAAVEAGRMVARELARQRSRNRM